MQWREEIMYVAVEGRKRKCISTLVEQEGVYERAVLDHLVSEIHHQIEATLTT